MSRTQGPHTHFTLITLCAVLAAGCGATLAPLPSGPGTPAPSTTFPAALEQATAQCRDVRTIRASLSLSGRAGDTRLRGRVDAGLAEPGQIRLEGLSPVPFGRPVFILVGRSSDATLVLPRDKRVLTDASADAIIEALTGVALTADELRAVLSGCGLPAATPGEATAHGSQWIAVRQGEVTVWLRSVDARWRMVAAARGPLEVRYEEFSGAHPSQIRIRTSSASAARADVTLRVSDVDTNVPLGPDVFRVEIPDDAVPMKLEELRRAVPRTADRG